ncbi:MAG: putative toxin-antitoxin system toxin component, PIN family [Gemmatimonadota bacterium]|nr:putative toxin-antitoxin system toxin component, PIN family [Gemmatimonadota bacterium]
MTTVRAVLDANVVVSALVLYSGVLSWLRGSWRRRDIRPLVSRETTAELIRVLAYPKFRLSADDRGDLLDDYLPCCETVGVPVAPPATPECRDPFDRPFLELALAGRADALVSSDADILAHADAFAVPILSPAVFRRRLLDSRRADK